MKTKTKLQIKEIQAAIDLVNAKRNAEVLPLNQELEQAFNAAFDTSEVIQGLIKTAEASRNYSLDETGDLISWTRVDVNALKAECLDDLDALQEYLNDYGFFLDVKNECVTQGCGDYIGISDDGDVYHQEMTCKVVFIASKEDYETRAERDALIGAYMEQVGLYPNVFQVGRYGDLTLVNTQAAKKGA